uniref:Endonuclease/exonuclease/phosphatase domain-containing protein n=1 Tax=Chromera velia CCMP2878 TaxID=1169474 RepID=A0A0G4HGE9_9ALVE|eukprot:Cvel_27345.t1-p1 / transcript=Cvel_27345.t1 / gene=Cvel_27345 / organism=Chromera_velia_CCMP2878 / gene_product=hypothetical protein / transcript_product=hypothetical protein / location=Cvel_scaffold3396:4096-7795(-) / protein_length=632 / sequence_SO=supercontig / SO=protein_coding / is_pseudo=false
MDGEAEGQGRGVRLLRPSEDTGEICAPSSIFSLMTWNVLLPNSSDGWWIYKYYEPHVPPICRQWTHRQRLIKERILREAPDIVCLQECAPDSFTQDFAFMEANGYVGLLANKGRFRNATFWKTSSKSDTKNNAVSLVEVCHGDRALVTGFQFKCLPTGAEGEGGEKSEAPNFSSSSASDTVSPSPVEKDPSLPVVFVVNCHLVSYGSPDRRLRQVHQALEFIRKQAQKSSAPGPQSSGKKGGGKGGGGQKAPPVEKTPVIVCGDFNSDGQTAVRELLVKGRVGPEYREPEAPSIEVVSKPKTHPFSKFADAYEGVSSLPWIKHLPSILPVPSRIPTLIVPLLDTKFQEGGKPSALFRKAIGRLFETFGGCGRTEDGQSAMDWGAVCQWLETVNKQVGRGSEYRSAIAILKRKAAERKGIGKSVEEGGGEETAVSATGGGTTAEGAENTGGEGDEGGEAEEISPEEYERELLVEEDFITIYAQELEEGKLWGIQHDLLACQIDVSGAEARIDSDLFSSEVWEALIGAAGKAVRAVSLSERAETNEDGQALETPGEGPADDPTIESLNGRLRCRAFRTTFDFIFYTEGPLSLEAVRDPLEEDEWVAALCGLATLPNETQPSDHLPQSATFTLGQ